MPTTPLRRVGFGFDAASKPDMAANGGNGGIFPNPYLITRSGAIVRPWPLSSRGKPPKTISATPTRCISEMQYLYDNSSKTHSASHVILRCFTISAKGNR